MYGMCSRHKMGGSGAHAPGRIDGGGNAGDSDWHFLSQNGVYHDDSEAHLLSSKQRFDTRFWMTFAMGR